MGQRANLVILRNAEWQLFYDHWCANRLDIELFWGPLLATSFIEQRAPLPDKNDWLDEVWCEGGVILDEDAQLLTWFGGEDIEDDIPLRRVFFELMKRQWPDWQLRWAEGGIVELGCYLGLSAEKFLVNRKPSGGFRVLTEYIEDNDVLLTVKQKGVTLVTRMSGDEESLEFGASQLGELLHFPLTESLVWLGYMPTGGVHIDVDTHNLSYWWANPVPAIEERISQAWNGWHAKWLHDRFEEHLNLASANIKLPDRNKSDLQRDLLERLRQFCTKSASNPARELGERLGVIELNPWTDEVRGSIGIEAKKRQLLDKLEQELSLGEA